MPKIGKDARNVFGIDIDYEESQNERLPLMKTAELAESKKRFSIEKIVYRENVENFEKTGVENVVYMTIRSAEAPDQRYFCIVRGWLVDTLHQLQYVADHGNTAVYDPTTVYHLEGTTSKAGRFCYVLKVDEMS